MCRELVGVRLGLRDRLSLVVAPATPVLVGEAVWPWSSALVVFVVARYSASAQKLFGARLLQEHGALTPCVEAGLVAGSESVRYRPAAPFQEASWELVSEFSVDDRSSL